jgi:hypothetical protein
MVSRRATGIPVFLHLEDWRPSFDGAVLALIADEDDARGCRISRAAEWLIDLAGR